MKYSILKINNGFGEEYQVMRNYNFIFFKWQRLMAKRYILKGYLETITEFSSPEQAETFIEQLCSRQHISPFGSFTINKGVFNSENIGGTIAVKYGEKIAFLFCLESFVLKRIY